MKKALLSILGLFILVACAVRLNTTINYSDMISDGTKNLMSDLRISVSSCSDEKIQEIQAEFTKRHIVANFNKCETGWNNYAIFSLPMELVKDDSAATSDIYLLYANNVLSIKTSSKFTEMLSVNSGLYSEKISISSMEFSFVNDAKTNVKIHTDLAFIDEKPVYNQTLELKPFSKTVIKLPDVANKLLENSNAEYRIFQVVE